MYDAPVIQAMIQVCALCWVAAYLLIIKRGFQDRSCGMPMIALCFNFSWELIFGFVQPDAPPMNHVNQVWFFIDAVIVYQYLRYGRARFPEQAPGWMFAPSFFIALLLAFGMVFSFTVQFDDFGGPWSGWTMNFAMSGLFIWWVLERADVDGQSLWIGVTKLLGTLGINVAQYQLTPGDAYLGFLYGGILLLDGIYVVLLYRKMRGLGINPWRRL
jgi:hypothetical protein